MKKVYHAPDVAVLQFAALDNVANNDDYDSVFSNNEFVGEWE